MWSSMKDINSVINCISKIKIRDNIILFNTRNNQTQELKVYKFIDYFVLLKWYFTKNYHLPNELIQKIIEYKYNLELNQFNVFNKLDLHLSMIQKINNIDNLLNKSSKKNTNLRILGYIFFDQRTFNSNTKICNYPSFQDIAQKYAGMGHIEVISRVKSNGLYFIRYDGGSNGYEVEYNEEKFMNLDLSKYQDRLMTFPELIDYILSIPENDMYDCTFKEKCIKF